MYTTQVEYGHLMACFAQTKELGEYCIIQRYERVLCGDQQLTNEKECPLLFRVKVLAVIPASAICTAVSIVHECGQSCLFQQRQKAGLWSVNISHALDCYMFMTILIPLGVSVYCMKCLNC